MKLFLIFHINVCFSSVEENERAKIVKNCYWPLLNLIEKTKIPLSIEASGYSLEEINKIDPKFIIKLKYLIKKGLCEFIDSGYSQLIGPLVPSKVNFYNLKNGKKIYKKLLNNVSKVAFVNEQAFSSGLINNYLTNKYNTIIMDWDNCFKSNKKIKKKYLYYPQKIISNNKKPINVIWSSSVIFQKFQKYVQGELGIKDYLSFIKAQDKKYKNSSLCIYASDLETINYRTKRYKTENILNDSEWDRVEKILLEFKKRSFEFMNPSSLLKLKSKVSNKNLIFDNPAFPCITKKQDKYNILRWAVTGRDDNKINSICWKIYEYFTTRKIKNLEYWKRLCYFWSSDFRTHITNKRWAKFKKDLNFFAKKFTLKNKKIHIRNKTYLSSLKLSKFDDKITAEGKNLKIVLNTKRGCSIEKYYDKRLSNSFLFGFVPQGFFDDISKGADFYTGHQVIEPLGKHKITDLLKTDVKINKWKNGIIVKSSFKNKIGNFKKFIFFDEINSKIGIKNEIKIFKNLNGSIRLSHITLNPNLFKKNLYYATHNGGKFFEKFKLSGKNFDHGKSVSHLVSANQAVGVTEGVIYLGDKSKKVCINIDRNFDTQVGMISYEKVKNKKFFRLYFSVKEHDDTTKNVKDFKIETLNWISTKGKPNEKR